MYIQLILSILLQNTTFYFFSSCMSTFPNTVRCDWIHFNFTSDGYSCLLHQILFRRDKSYLYVSRELCFFFFIVSFVPSTIILTRRLVLILVLVFFLNRIYNYFLLHMWVICKSRSSACLIACTLSLPPLFRVFYRWNIQVVIVVQDYIETCVDVWIQL